MYFALPPASILESFITPKTFSTQNLQIRKFCCTFAPKFGKMYNNTRCYIKLNNINK